MWSLDRRQDGLLEMVFCRWQVPPLRRVQIMLITCDQESPSLLDGSSNATVQRKYWLEYSIIPQCALQYDMVSSYYLLDSKIPIKQTLKALYFENGNQAPTTKALVENCFLQHRVEGGSFAN